MKAWKMKALALALCLTALVCLSSCGSDGGDEAATADDNAATDDATATTDDNAATDDATATVDDNAAQTETRVLQLGTSAFSVTIPSYFIEGEVTDEDRADDVVAYYRSDDTLMDFDVYQFSKEGYADTLAEFVTAEAADYNASEVVTDAEINGIAVGYYRSVEESDGTEYNVITYALEDGDEYVEVVFWLDGDTAEAEADAIINTLAK